MINEEEVFPLFSNVNKLYEHGDQIVFDLTFAMNLPDKVDFNIRFQQSPIVLYTFEFDVPVIIEIEE